MLYSAFDLAEKDNSDLSSLHILYLILEDSEKYLKVILINFSNKIDNLKNEIFLFLNQIKISTNLQYVDKSILILINKSKLLMKQFNNQLITRVILLLSFTLINDQAKEILSK